MFPLLEKTCRPSVLFLTHRVPFPPDKGDRIRTFQILRYLAQRADVHLACLADEPVDSDALVTLRKYCRQLAVVPLGGFRWARAAFSLATGRTASEGAFSSNKLREIVRSWAAQTHFHVALGSASSMAPYLRLPELAQVPAVVDLVDVDSQKWFDYASMRRGPKAWLYRLEGRRLRGLERHLTTWAKAVVLISAAEANIFRSFCPGGVLRTIGNGVDLDYFRPQAVNSEQGCVFLGALDYQPNIDGVCWFCREVWPSIHGRNPETTFSLVGRRPTASVRRLGDIPGVKVIGQVPDVRPFLAQAALSLVPLRIARGVQNKVLESLAMGKATIVSPQALEGIVARHGEHLLTASSAQEWVDVVDKLLADKPLRRRLAVAGRGFAETHHRWQNCLRPLDELLGLGGQNLAAAGLTPFLAYT